MRLIKIQVYREMILRLELSWWKRICADSRYSTGYLTVFCVRKGVNSNFDILTFPHKSNVTVGKVYLPARFPVGTILTNGSDCLTKYPELSGFKSKIIPEIGAVTYSFFNWNSI